jgi:hypothetical protein
MSEWNFKEKEKLVTVPRWVPDTRTDSRLTVVGKLTSTSLHIIVTFDAIQFVVLGAL